MKIQSKKEEYNPREYFESWYGSSDEITDKITISPNFNPLGVKYHYNQVENSIIECFYDVQLPENLRVLDIGSGSGHWIDFYLSTFKARFCMGVDISQGVIDALGKKFTAGNIKFACADISTTDFNLDTTFDIINAIGVMFHIVNDQKFSIALDNLSAHLASGGYLVVGGAFGAKTEDVQFHKTDQFKSWEERKAAWEKFNNTPEEVVLVNKRVRSLNDWTMAAQKSGLEVIDLIRTRNEKNIKTPENNILILRKP